MTPTRPACLSELGGQLRRGRPAPRERAERADRPEPRLGGAPDPHRWSAGAVCLAERNREALLRIPPLVALGAAEPGERSCAWSTAARTRPPTRTSRSARSCAPGSRACAPTAGAAAPRPRPRAARRGRGASATASARCRPRWRTRCSARRGRTARAWLAPLLYDAYVGLKRAELDAVAELDLSEVCRRYAASTEPSCWSALLAGDRARAAARRAAAPPPARRPRARPRRASARRRRRRGAARCVRRPSPGPACFARVGARRGRGRGGARGARRPADARAHGRALSAQRGDDDARLRARRPHGRARRAGARGARARRGAAGAAAGASSSRARRRYPSGAEQLARGELARDLAGGGRRGARASGAAVGRASRSTPGAVNASCDTVEITVEGEPTHGAYPHRGRDPILALAQIVVALHAQVGAPDRPARGGVADRRRARGRQRRERDPRAGTRAGRAARPPPRGSPRAARAGGRRSPPGSPRPTAAARSVELTEGEPALENDPAHRRAPRASCSPARA